VRVEARSQISHIRKLGIVLETYSNPHCGPYRLCLHLHALLFSLVHPGLENQHCSRGCSPTIQTSSVSASRVRSTNLRKIFTRAHDGNVFHSDTTRGPRPGEINGKEYHFVTREQFLALVDAGGFIEHAVFSKNLYGTSVKAVKDVATLGKRCILDIDAQVRHVILSPQLSRFQLQYLD
jgi:hypothetical protein